MLFALFVISVLVTVGLAIYAGGALIGVRSQKVESFAVPPLPVQPPAPVPVVMHIQLADPPRPPARMARGTTPQPFATTPARAPSPIPTGVISSRDDGAEPDADARFSVKRSSQRRLS